MKTAILTKVQPSSMTRRGICLSVDCPATRSGTSLSGDRARVKIGPPMPGVARDDFSGAPASSPDDMGPSRPVYRDIWRNRLTGRSNVCADGSEGYVITKRVGGGSACAPPPPPTPPLRVAGRPDRARSARPLRLLGQRRWGRRPCPRPRGAGLGRPRVRRAGWGGPGAFGQAVADDATEPHREEPPGREHPRLP